MTKRLLISLIILLVTLSACGGNTTNNSPAVNQTNPIEWDRDPKTIVFRADVSGGNDDPFYALSEVPVCTIYGDNHIVWINELGVNNIQVLEDRISDDAVREFVSYVALNKQLYNYSAKADTVPLSDPKPVVETLTLFVNKVNHKTDAFGGWDYDYYLDIVTHCQRVSTSPVIYVPTGAWISARTIPYDSQAARQPWDAKANNLSLKDLAASGQPKWITDRNVGVFWNMFLTSPKNIQYIEDNVEYNVAVQVPNITRDSPPAP
ncbi:MAG: hypothetical protein GC179_15830 [Anaerolineaceae bacterium]|nr:hypothetical protein [Anaerolineaceae bacterium]